MIDEFLREFVCILIPFLSLCTCLGSSDRQLEHSTYVPVGETLVADESARVS